MYLFIVYILTKLKTSLQKEKLLARRDYLTGAFNRTGFFENLEIELYRMRRDGRQLTLAYLDVDNLKSIDDRLGHDTGDKMLIALTNTNQENIRKSDILARLGGDEFVVLFPSMDLHNAEKTIQKIRIAIRNNFNVNG
jgi:diguanylate cyclase (GGDEF)-like protein